MSPKKINLSGAKAPCGCSAFEVEVEGDSIGTKGEHSTRWYKCPKHGTYNRILKPEEPIGRIRTYRPETDPPAS